MAEDQAGSPQHTLALMRRMGARIDELRGRLTHPERRLALRDEEAGLDRIGLTDLRSRVDRIEHRLGLPEVPFN